MITNSVPVPLPLQELQSDVHNLERRLVALELESQEGKKPWFRQPSMIVSIAALVVSTGFSSYTALTESGQRKHEEIAKKLETLRATVLQIEDLRDQWLQAQLTIGTSSPQFSQRDSLINTKKQVLMENADAIISDIRTSVSPSIFEVLASESQVDSKYREAETYYQLGLESEYGSTVSQVNTEKLGWRERVGLWFNKRGMPIENTGYNKLYIKKDLALLYLQPNTVLYDPNRGRRIFQEVVSELEPHKDVYATDAKTFVLANWAGAEFLNGNTAAARNLRDQAMAQALKLPQWNVHRESYLANIDHLEQLYTVTGGNTTAATPQINVADLLNGEWKVLYGEDSSASGIALFYVAPQTKSITMNMSVFKNNKLIKKYIGNPTASTGSSIQVDWTGSTFPPLALGPYITGSTILSVSKGGSTATGREYTLGDETRALHLTKLKGSK